MRAVIQRVTQASVTIDGKIKSAIQNGLLVFVGIDSSDSDLGENYSNNEVTEMKWFEIKHAVQLDLAFGHAKVIQEYFKVNHL